MVSLVALAEHGSRVEASLAMATRKLPRPRLVSRSAGHALEILGHAIEYLTDQYVEQPTDTNDLAAGQLEAIQILMALNRSIYFDCPEKPGLVERVGALCRFAFSRHQV
ncbi:MAG: hypothetical protein ACLGSD_03990 [Acidobacteriota bacterium]